MWYQPGYHTYYWYFVLYTYEYLFVPTGTPMHSRAEHLWYIVPGMK